MAKGDPGGLPGGGGQHSTLGAIGAGMNAAGGGSPSPDMGGGDDMSAMIKQLMEQMWLKKQPLPSRNPTEGMAPQQAPSLPPGFNSGDVGGFRQSI